MAWVWSGLGVVDMRMEQAMVRTMCGRFALSETIPILRQVFQAGGPEIPWAPSWNICPTRSVPVLLGGTAGRRIGLMHWGWRPAALRGRLLINCRGEESPTKPLFQEVLVRRRCALLLSSFYEWQPAAERGQRPQPYCFAPVPARPVAVAGFWERRTGDDPGGACILLTMPANDLVAPVHDRMPAVLADDAIDTWLDTTIAPSVALAAATTGLPGTWDRWRVGPEISQVRADGPSLAARIATPGQGT